MDAVDDRDELHFAYWHYVLVCKHFDDVTRWSISEGYFGEDDSLVALTEPVLDWWDDLADLRADLFLMLRAFGNDDLPDVYELDSNGSTNGQGPSTS